ncbi:MAG: hypothetical protein QN172_10050 [Armatimonadota bacterium]|nr:hypothetical protein [Armatimonadota bacterium]MDR7438640.1 hypothetical protein [Armatimonadota bacterium]MDR7562639.1 hypothetical protein [Armatimonadota bacterium]MDR7567207.1 hypothetical protein [Armatimonadota bacterium]MDR7602782.1 hypothetical protein [Armatimonadota bacterium]
MEIDLDRAKQVLVKLSEALQEVREVVRVDHSGLVRLRTNGRTIELPLAWAAAGLLGLLVASVVSGMQGRERIREEEPLGIG